MYPILIHVLGYLLINSFMPNWVDEAGWLVLSAWYGSFVAIDMIAIMVCHSQRILVALAASCAWSAAIMLEVCLGSDLLQSHDWLAQAILTSAIVIAALIELVEWRKGRAAQVGKF